VRGGIAAIALIRPLPALAGVLVPAALLALVISDGGVAGIVAASLLVVVGLAVAVGWSLAIRLRRDLPTNHLGLCSGMPGRSGAEPALTQWLADEIDTLAARRPDEGPLTFGDLTERGIELAMFTTDLSAGVQSRLPFESRIWAFKPEEMRQLFPARVVDWMVEHAATPRDNDDREVFERFAADGLHPLPPPADVPVIVGVRMSLSFPILLGTVPLHAFDYTRNPPKIIRHRFSDGGITSNFPIHFFDHAVPDAPTFGINLRRVKRLRPDPADNVSMPDDNRDGILARSKEVETLGAFVGALRNSVQNWADSMQTRVPGYRDRIVAVEHTKSEGGMNLDMDQPVVLGLAERGRFAGERAAQFDLVNHRWVRFRSFLEVLSEFVVPAARSIDAPGRDGVPSYREMIAGQPPPSYRRGWNAGRGTEVANAIVNLAAAFGDDDGTDAVAEPDRPEPQFSRGAPSPKPVLQIRPRP
jgi:hypothetical protein